MAGKGSYLGSTLRKTAPGDDSCREARVEEGSCGNLEGDGAAALLTATVDAAELGKFTSLLGELLLPTNGWILFASRRFLTKSMPNMQNIRKHIAETAMIAISERMAESGSEIVSSPMVKPITPIDSKSPDLKLTLNLSITSLMERDEV